MTEKTTQVFKILRLLFLAFIVSRGLYSCVFVSPAPPPALFTPTTPPADYSIPPAVVADHQQVVTLNPALLKQGRFSFTLFSATTYIALLDRVEEQRPGVFTWIGHLQGERDSQVKVIVQDQVIHGVIQLHQTRYELQPLHDNLYAFYERDLL